MLWALLKTMRPKQWAKNGFVFAGIFFDQKLNDPQSLLRVLISFGLLCLAASTIYLINDLVDVEKDRRHPRKRFRPIAAGELPVPIAQAAAVLFLALSLGGALLLSPALAAVVLLYLLIHIVYSFALKNIVIIDVFAIAAGFVLRVVAGVVVIDIRNFSPWLYVCAGLLSLFLAIGKRRQEFLQLGANASAARPVFEHYNLPFVNDLLRLVIASTAIAYTLYAAEAETLVIRTEYMLLTVPIVYYGLFRYLYIIHVEGKGGDPTEVLYEDRPLQLSILAWVVVLLVMLYII